METNTLYSQNSKILKKNKSNLGFRLSFGFMPLIQLSQLIGLIYNVVLMRRAGVNWFDFSSIGKEWKNANGMRGENTNNFKNSLDSESKAVGSL